MGVQSRLVYRLFLAWLEIKKLEIKWHKEYKLDEAGLAHSDITGGKTSGKLVLFPE